MYIKLYYTIYYKKNEKKNSGKNELCHTRYTLNIMLYNIYRWKYYFNTYTKDKIS